MAASDKKVSRARDWGCNHALAFLGHADLQRLGKHGEDNDKPHKMQATPPRVPSPMRLPDRRIKLSIINYFHKFYALLPKGDCRRRKFTKEYPKNSGKFVKSLAAKAKLP